MEKLKLVPVVISYDILKYFICPLITMLQSILRKMSVEQLNFLADCNNETMNKYIDNSYIWYCKAVSSARYLKYPISHMTINNPNVHDELINHIRTRKTIKYLAIYTEIPDIDEIICEINPVFLDLSMHSRVSNIVFYRMSQLEELIITFIDNITDEEVKQLTKLQVFNVRGCNGIKGNCLSHLKLHTLVIISNDNIADEHIRNLHGLVNLTLGMGCLISNSGIENLTGLKYLNIAFNDVITNEGLRNLNLISLNLSCNRKITDGAILHMTELKELELSASRITDDGISQCRKLEYLNISHAKKITGRALREMKELRVIEMLGNSIEQEFIISLPKLSLIITGDCCKYKDISCRKYNSFI